MVISGLVNDGLVMVNGEWLLDDECWFIVIKEGIVSKNSQPAHKGVVLFVDSS